MSEEMVPSQDKVATGSKTNLILVGAILVLLVGGAAALALNQNTANKTVSQPDTSPMITATPIATPIDEDAGLMEGSMALEASPEATPASVDMMETEVRTITIEAGAFYYKPSSITVKKGEKVKVVLNSKDMMHNFVVDELGITAPITKGGETSTFEFTADKAGTFEYYCSVGQHRKNGQVGTLVVTE